MSKIEVNALVNAFRGRLGNIILKKYASGIVVSKRPDRSKVKLSKNQKKANGLFKEAVAYAKAVIKDPEQRKAYEVNLQPGKTVYHTALADYLRKKGSEQ